MQGDDIEMCMGNAKAVHDKAYPLRSERFPDHPRKALSLKENVNGKLVRNITEMVNVDLGNDQ